MELHLLDGDVIECPSFRAIDGGVLLFDEPPGEDADREATGFVPHGEVRYVLSAEQLAQLDRQRMRTQRQPPQDPAGQDPAPGSRRQGAPPGR